MNRVNSKHIFVHFLLFLYIHMVLWKSLWWTCLSKIVNNWWWPGDTMSQGISSHDIDLVLRNITISAPKGIYVGHFFLEKKGLQVKWCFNIYVENVFRFWCNIFNILLLLKWAVQVIHFQIRHLSCFISHQSLFSNKMMKPWSKNNKSGTNFCFAGNVMNDYYPTQILLQMAHLSAMSPEQNDHNFPYNTFKCIFLNEIFQILFAILLKFVPSNPVDNKLALFQVATRWRTIEK